MDSVLSRDCVLGYVPKSRKEVLAARLSIIPRFHSARSSFHSTLGEYKLASGVRLKYVYQDNLSVPPWYPCISLRMDTYTHPESRYSAYLNPFQSTEIDYTSEPHPWFSQHQLSLDSHHTHVEHPPEMFHDPTATGASIPTGTILAWDQVLAVRLTLFFHSSACTVLLRVL